MTTAIGTHGPAGRRVTLAAGLTRAADPRGAALFLAVRGEAFADEREADRVFEDEAARRVPPFFPEEAGVASRREAPRCDGVLLLMRRVS
jgi:hypothetical protein